MADYLLPWPPSINEYYACVRGRSVLCAKGRAYKKHVASLALVNMGKWKTFGLKKLSMRIYLIPPNNRCDIDNRLKPILDSLQYVSVYKNDNQIKKLHVYILKANKLSSLVIVKIVELRK